MQGYKINLTLNILIKTLNRFGIQYYLMFKFQNLWINAINFSKISLRSSTHRSPPVDVVKSDYTITPGHWQQHPPEYPVPILSPNVSRLAIRKRFDGRSMWLSCQKRQDKIMVKIQKTKSQIPVQKIFEQQKIFRGFLRRDCDFRSLGSTRDSKKDASARFVFMIIPIALRVPLCHVVNE